MPTEMSTSTLLLILCIPDKITTTSCSKVPQGLHFPMDVRGIFATQYFQKFSTRDSSDLVKPFMHVAIHTTRHYAQLCCNQEIKFLMEYCFQYSLNVAIKFGLYLNKDNQRFSLSNFPLSCLFPTYSLWGF